MRGDPHSYQAIAHEDPGFNPPMCPCGGYMVENDDGEDECDECGWQPDPLGDWP